MPGFSQGCKFFLIGSASGIGAQILFSSSFAFSAKSLLGDSGYSVTTAANGEEGLRLASAMRPDLIVVDHLIPGAMEGPALIRRLKNPAALLLQ